MNKRKFQHTKLEIAIMIAYTTLVAFGLTNVVYHLMFNDPALLRLIALELGIVPNTSMSMDGDEIKKMLDQLSADDARRCKRKFRKLHRKLRKSRKREFVRTKERVKIKKDENKYGMPGSSPTQSQRRRRRELERNFVDAEVRKKMNV